MIKIELQENEFDMILLALGYATGAAMKKDRKLAETFLFAANVLNRGNPNWEMYELADDLKPDEIVRRFMASVEKRKP